MTHDDVGVAMYCHAGCPTIKICTALGLHITDLGHRDKSSTESRIVARYDYITLAGEHLATKCRLVPRSFRWQSPDGTWSLKNGSPDCLYRIPDVIDCKRVYLVEGEKACDLLHTNQVAAVSPPCGAGKWSDRWTDLLITTGCTELFILADNDVPGKRHAEIVAASAYARELKCKVIDLPNLPRGADVFDYIATGHTMGDVEIAAHSEPWWHPGLAEARRKDRIRKQTLARVHKHRAIKRGMYRREAV